MAIPENPCYNVKLLKRMLICSLYLEPYISQSNIYSCVASNYSDGTSLVVSDEVGQIYIFGTGSKMSEKDVKYDQVGYFELLIYSWFCMLSHHILLSFEVRVVQCLLNDCCVALVHTTFSNLNSGIRISCMRRLYSGISSGLEHLYFLSHCCMYISCRDEIYSSLLKIRVGFLVVT